MNASTGSHAGHAPATTPAMPRTAAANPSVTAPTSPMNIRAGGRLTARNGIQPPTTWARPDLASTPHSRDACPAGFSSTSSLEPSRDQGFVDFQQVILEQDRVVVESQRPEELPIDLSEELHIKGVDRVSIDYRRWLGEIANGG